MIFGKQSLKDIKHAIKSIGTCAMFDGKLTSRVVFTSKLDFFEFWRYQIDTVAATKKEIILYLCVIIHKNNR